MVQRRLAGWGLSAVLLLGAACSGSGDSGGTTCYPGEYACGGRCVDPATDPDYCGAGEDCTGGEACGAASFCSAGACWSPCESSQAFCDGQCIDPAASAAHCGASGLCQGAAAGVACRADQVCSGGSCACPADRVACGEACVDPLTDAAHCGASLGCLGAAAGEACTAGQVCDQGSCSTLQDLDWRPALLATAPPHFAEDADPLAHIVYDGASGQMVDLTGRTTWTMVGAVGATESGMWSPAQWASGPFDAGAYWIGDAASRDHLNAGTAGDFTVCARYAPGVHPGYGPTKVVMAAGKPESPGAAGWALLQHQWADNFTYHDASATGVWMAYSAWGLDSAAVSALEWSWQCGGRDGDALRVLRESFSSGGYTMPAGGQPEGPVGDFQPSADLPTIGAYADGTSALLDGAVYEIVVSAVPATDANMRNLVARAAGGLTLANEGARQLPGADGQLHLGAPATVPVRADGSVAAEARVVLGGHLHQDPTVTGACLGVVASSTDWSGLGTFVIPLRWQGSDPASRLDLRWHDGAALLCAHVDHSGGELFACGAPPWLGAGSTHTFLHCIDAGDGTLRLYADGSTTPFATSLLGLTPEQLPRLDDPQATLSLEIVDQDLGFHRVFACPTADPAACR